MRTSGTDTARRLRDLRMARREIARVSKPGARAMRDLKRLDAATTRIRGWVAGGKLSKDKAAPALKRITRARREIVRLQATSLAVTRQTLAVLDREIRRARGGR